MILARYHKHIFELVLLVLVSVLVVVVLVLVLFSELALVLVLVFGIGIWISLGTGISSDNGSGTGLGIGIGIRLGIGITSWRLKDGSGRTLGDSMDPGRSPGTSARLQEVLRRSGHRQIVSDSVKQWCLQKLQKVKYVFNDYHQEVMIRLHVFVQYRNFTKCFEGRCSKQMCLFSARQC
jgi:thiol:disulfide interchange protein